MFGIKGTASRRSWTGLVRRGLSVFFCALLFCLTFLPHFSHAASNEPTRVINVVYDDSGSMYVDDNNHPLDTWRQAHYALEVFAAMLGQNDTMNVYAMGQFDSQVRNSADPLLTLHGSDGAAANAGKVHDLRFNDNGTPFNAVREAYDDLAAVSADERWLVVLTDGELCDGVDPQGYQIVIDPAEVNGLFAAKAPGISVMYLGMGVLAQGFAANLNNDPENDIFIETAPGNADILNKITGIATRIFNSNSFSVPASSASFSVDIPMSEMIVFAQGENVRIDGLEHTGADGSEPFEGSSVEVRWSDLDNPRYSSFTYQEDRSLQGRLATFTGALPSGDYSLDIAGDVATIEVFYKPDIDIAAYLIDADGHEVTDLSNLEAGDYTIRFGFVRTGTNERVPASGLLGDMDYNAAVSINGNTQEVRSGDQITIEEGGLLIEAEAHFLEYNTVATTLDYRVYANKDVTFNVRNDREFQVGMTGFREGEYLEIEALIDGRPPTPEQWAQMGVPEIGMTDDGDRNIIERIFRPLPDGFTIEKTDEPGIYRVYPVLEDGRPSFGTYDDTDFSLNFTQTFDSGESWRGDFDSTAHIHDGRFILWRLVPLWILLAIIAILVGYLPFVKCYLPRNLKRRPESKGRCATPGVAPVKGKGRFEKNLASTIIPYRPQTGTIRYVPQGVSGAPILKVRAIRGNMMTIMNLKSFVNKAVTFDGTSVRKDDKSLNIPASVRIQYKAKTWTYTCYPNVDSK